MQPAFCSIVLLWSSENCAGKNKMNAGPGMPVDMPRLHTYSFAVGPNSKMRRPLKYVCRNKSERSGSSWTPPSVCRVGASRDLGLVVHYPSRPKVNAYVASTHGEASTCILSNFCYSAAQVPSMWPWCDAFSYLGRAMSASRTTCSRATAMSHSHTH